MSKSKRFNILIGSSLIISAGLAYGVYQLMPFGADRRSETSSNESLNKVLGSVPSPTPTEPNIITVGDNDNLNQLVESTPSATVFKSALVSSIKTAVPEESNFKQFPFSCDQFENQIIQDPKYQRDLAIWKPQISSYSSRHYGEPTWKLEPSVIVLHYTVGTSFPWNLVNTPNFAGETPGLSVHYVVDGPKIWRLLPDNVRSRGAYGINHRAINIEMIALEEKDLFQNRKPTLDKSAELVACLMQWHKIPINKIYSHEDVSKMNPKIVPEVFDLVQSGAYGKSDPGELNMAYVLNKLKLWGLN